MDTYQGSGLLIRPHPDVVAIATKAMHVAVKAILVEFPAGNRFDLFARCMKAEKPSRFGTYPQITVFVRNDFTDVTS